MNQDQAGRSARLRAFYARLVTERAGTTDPRIEQAFAAVPREPFAGPPPWWIPVANRQGGVTYLPTPDGDPAYLYQDVLVALDRERGINIGEPSLHARCLDALSAQPGETALHVGAGSGYYTAILAQLLGAAGRVHAFEISPALAARAMANLADRPSVQVHARSGTAEGLPEADIVYVSAGLTGPSRAWTRALRPGGRLLFPLQPHGAAGRFGGMLLATRPMGDAEAWPARFVSRATFIACEAPQDEDAGRALARAFAAGAWQEVRSLRLGGAPDASCWAGGEDWWLSTDAPPGPPPG